MTGPTRDTTAGRAYLDLRRLGEHSNRGTGELLALYALEGFLDRLAVSDGAADFVLKGGVLLAVYDSRRPTRDVDLQAPDLDNDIATVLARVRGIAAITRPDGLLYDAAGATAETIRDADEYAGVRVSMACQLATARLRFHVDVNVGDPVWPPPGLVQLPRLLGGSITVRGYPLAMVHAEKIVTAVQRGRANTRWRDFADVYLLSGRHRVDGTQLETSVRLVAGYRGAVLGSLTDTWGDSAGSVQPSWVSWVRRQRLEDRLPGLFTTVLDAVAQFADPPLLGTAAGRTWDPTDRTWRPASLVAETRPPTL